MGAKSNNCIPFLDVLEEREAGKKEKGLQYLELLPTLLHGTQSIKELTGRRSPSKITRTLQVCIKPIIKRTLSKLISVTLSQAQVGSDELDKRSAVVLQYCGQISDKFMNKLRATYSASVIYTTRKLKSVPLSLNSSVPNVVISRVIYHIVCPGSSCSYVGKNNRPFLTLLMEHSAPTAYSGAHFDECVGSRKNL